MMLPLSSFSDEGAEHREDEKLASVYNTKWEIVCQTLWYDVGVGLASW